MADKQIVSLIIKANLECEKCCKKIQKVLNKLKDKEKIMKIDFDNSKNKVTIWGHFKQEELAHKLRCKACEAIKDIEFGKPEAKKEEKKPDGKKEEKKQPEEKKPDDKKPEEKKKADDKKPDEGKKEEKKPAGDEKEEKPKVKEETKATPAPSSTTVNLQFTHMCGICYPWPCSDPTHWGGGVHPQWPQCDGGMAPAAPPALPAFPGHHHHQHPPWGAVPAPKWPCGGPSYCGGCGTCRGGGWPAMPAPPMQPMCCPGPSSCRGCKGCRIVQEGKFIYEEYPPNACAVM